MCRYVMAVPPKPEDKEHKLRMVFGNGLRPQIWEEFKARFNVSKVKEFYGATEGNANISKFCNLLFLYKVWPLNPILSEIYIFKKIQNNFCALTCFLLSFFYLLDTS